MNLEYTMKKSIWSVALMTVTTAAFMCFLACSSDDPITDPMPKPNPNNGAVTFTIDLPQGIGDGSSTSPVEVKKGETLDMTIRQKSSYTDPDGTVFTCEPKATIKISAKMDTVVAKDLKELTKVKEGSDIETDKTGTSPVLNQTVQTFEIGGQNIVFDLSHEIYTYVTSTKDKIEMPYIKLNQVKFGSTGATEETLQGRSAAVVTGVTVRPLMMSRATTLRDSTMYEVNVRFSLDLESVNAKENTKKTLEFSVNYVGIVETITELADPVAELSYKWDIKSGTTSAASPFVKTKGETPMEIWMTQYSSFTDEYGNKATGEPKAKIKLSVAQDTVWAKTLDELKKFAAKEGGSSSEQAATQKFGSDIQNVDIEWSYEVGEAVLADKTISMPFYTLTPVTLKDVSVKEVSDGVTVAGKEATVYEVTATFSQKAVAKNVENVTTETPEVELEYVVSYIGAVELTLVKVEYIPSGRWVDPHDNMVLAYYAKVERYRTYSNGKRVGPDEFFDYGHSVQLRYVTYDLGRIYFSDGAFWSEIYPSTVTEVGDSICTLTRSIQVSKLVELSAQVTTDRITSEVKFKDWNNYRLSAPEDASLNLAKDFDNPEYPRDDRPSGWYYQLFMYSYGGRSMWKAADNWNMQINTLTADVDFYDQFLVIDGRRIDFSKLHNLKMEGSISETAFSDSHKEGEIHKVELRASYLGKNFYSSQTDSIYVAK